MWGGWYGSGEAFGWLLLGLVLLLVGGIIFTIIVEIILSSKRGR